MPNLERKLTQAEVQRVFDVTTMTLFLWRKGTATKTALKTVKGKGRAVLYREETLRAWAEKNDVVIVVDPDDLHIEHKARGPKPRLAEAV